MKIFAKAECYSGLRFDGYIEIDVTEEDNGWYRLPLTKSIKTFDGPFQIEAGYTFSGYFHIKIDNDAEISGNTIRASKKAFLGQGYLDTTETNSLLLNNHHLLVKEDTLLSFNYVEVETLPKFSFNEENVHIQFVPDDEISFSERPFGFCVIYFYVGGKSFFT